MSKRKSPAPTEAELEILNVLWQQGPSTVRQVHDKLKRNRPTGYTSVLKFLQIMTQKGLVLRDESQRTHVYRPRFKEEQTQKQLVRDLMQRGFRGSAEKLVMQALSVKKVSTEELAEIRRLLDELEKETP